MLKYLIIPLADNSVSFCQYNSKQAHNLVTVGLLEKAVLWAMKSNLTIQFVYPREPIPANISDLISSINHADIVPCDADSRNLLADADIVVVENWESLNGYEFIKGQSYVVRTSLTELLVNKKLLKALLSKVFRINIVLLDIPYINETALKDYDDLLHELIPDIVSEYTYGHQVQINVLTDRLVLNRMNNCNAGYESVTLAPNGNFYVCPAFYFNAMESIGDLEKGLDIKNPLIYKLNHAPICRSCDAWQCKRCVWLNKKITGEINTPSHEQCSVAHIERNASRDLLLALREIDSELLSQVEIPVIDYLDPFDNIINKIY